MDLNIPNEVMAFEDIADAINWAAFFAFIILTIVKKICFVAVCFYGCVIFAFVPLLLMETDMYVIMVLIAATFPGWIPWILFVSGSLLITIQTFHYIFENYIWP